MNSFETVVKRKLDFLACPLIRDVDQSWISDLVFSPSHHRLDLLEWLIVRFDQDLAEILECRDRLHDSMDSRVERILSVASSLCLCSTDDADLVKGVTVGKPQMSFILTLIDLACSSQELGQDIDWTRLSRDCLTLDKVSCEPLSKIYGETLNLLPPDLSKIISIESQKLKRPSSLCSSSSSLLALVPDVGQLKSELEQLDEMLDKFKEEPNKAQPFCKPIKLECEISLLKSLLSDLDALLTSFLCWSNEIKIHKSSVQRYDLGPHFDVVNDLSQEFCSLLSSLASARNKYQAMSCVMENMPRDNDEQVKKILQTLSSCHKVLQQTVALKNVHN